MPPKPNRKEILLRLFLYLFTLTDSEHPLSRKEISWLFHKEDPNMSDRYVKDCVEAIRALGFPIEETQEGHTRLYYSRTGFNFWIYTTLIVLTEEAKFLSRDVTDQIVEALCMLAPKGTEEKLRSACFYYNLSKTKNNETAKSISAAIQAILEDKKLSFVFSTPGFECIRHPLGETPLKASPVSLVPDSDKLYLCCRLEAEDFNRCIRIENLQNTAILDEPIAEAAVLERQTLSHNCSGRFSMFQGIRCEDVTLVFLERCLRSVYDRFGENIRFTKVDEVNGEPVLKATVSVEVSPYFHWWVVESGGFVRVIGPSWVIEDQIRTLEKNNLQYICPEPEKIKQPGSANPDCQKKTNS